MRFFVKFYDENYEFFKTKLMVWQIEDLDEASCEVARGALMDLEFGIKLFSALLA